MILYLRNKDNETIFEVEVYVDSNEERGDFVELSANIYIENYSNFLLDNLKKKKKIIHTFENLSHLRGWLWERYFITDKNDGTQIDDVINKLNIILTKVAKDLKLDLIPD